MIVADPLQREQNRETRTFPYEPILRTPRRRRTSHHNTRRAAGAGDRAGLGERGWTSRPGCSEDPEKREAMLGRQGGGAVVGGEMGRFQSTRRTGSGGRDEVSFYVWDIGF